jgi:hypothetical protein
MRRANESPLPHDPRVRRQIESFVSHDAGSRQVGRLLPMAAPTHQQSLPRNLHQAVRAEFNRAFHTPYETLIAVFANGLLVTLAWFLIPNGGLFTLHGALAFPIVLSSWMYSDVPATNLLGADAERILLALDDPKALWRMLVAKSAVLWSLVVPVCTLVAIAVGSKEDRPLGTLFTILWIAVFPLGALGLSAYVGVWFPYHPLSLRYRWTNRKPFRRKIVRWTLITVAPYLVVPYLTVIVAIPSILIWVLTSQQHGLTRIPDGDFAWGVVVGCIVASISWLVGLRFAVRLARRRRSKLATFLSHPDLG